MIEKQSLLAVESIAEEPATWRPVIGDVVRIVLTTDHACHEAPHFPGEAGRTGRILRVQPTLGTATHPFLVMLERPGPDLRVGRIAGATRARHYAAHELEPVDVGEHLTSRLREGARPSPQ
jgi:hypothetical protein